MYLIFLLIFIIIIIILIIKSNIVGSNEIIVYELEIPESKWLPKEKKEIMETKITKEQKYITPENADFFPKKLKEFRKLSTAQINKIKYLLESFILLYSKKLPIARTNFNIPFKKPGKLPPGVLMYNIDYYKNITDDLKDLFDNAEKYNYQIQTTSKGIEHIILNKDKLFKSFGDRTQFVQHIEDVEFIKNKKLYDYIHEIHDFVKNIQNNEYKVSIARNVSTKGIKLHIDEISFKKENVFSFNLGTTIYYDMTPLFTEGTPVRIKIKPGTLIGLTGDARLRWTHGIPNDIPNINKRYNFLFKS